MSHEGHKDCVECLLKAYTQVSRTSDDLYIAFCG